MKDKCWQCGGRLVRPYFALVGGMRVHKICEKDAEIALGLKSGEKIGAGIATGATFSRKESDDL